MSITMKLNIVNKHEYEEQEDYREIILKIPNQIERLERDFKYLGLDYNDLSIQDTHILNCEIIDKSDQNFSTEITTAISNIIARASDSGYTSSYQYVIKMFAIINTLDNEDKYKLLAILESERQNIYNLKDAIKFANNINCFELFDVYDEEELARRLIYNQEIYMEDVMEYADLQRLGKDVSEDQGIIKTNQGYLRQNEDIKNEKIQEETEEEEF